MNKLLAFSEYGVLTAISVLIFFAPFSKTITKFIFLLLIPLIVFNGVLRHKKNFFKVFFLESGVSPYMLFFLISIVLSVIFSLDFYHSQIVLVNRYLYYIVIFLIGCYFFKSKRNILWVVILFFISSVVISVGGIKDYLYFYGERLIFSFGRIINFTPILVLYLPLSLIVAFFARNRLLRIAAEICSVLLFICLIWNASRLAIMAVPVSILAVFYIKNKKIIGITLAVLLIACALFAPARNKDIYARFEADSIGDRGALWMTAVKIFKSFPVSGSGLGMYEKLLYKYGPEKGYSEGKIHLHSHNVYLELLSETGIIGIAAFLSLLTAIFMKIYKASKLSRDPDTEAIAMGLMAGIIASLVLAGGSAILFVDFQAAALFWLILGTAVGAASVG